MDQSLYILQFLNNVALVDIQHIITPSLCSEIWTSLLILYQRNYCNKHCLDRSVPNSNNLTMFLVKFLLRFSHTSKQTAFSESHNFHFFVHMFRKILSH